MLDINRCSVEDLAALATVGEQLSRAIVNARLVQNGFSKLEDLLQVEGITEDFIEVNRAHLSCCPYKTIVQSPDRDEVTCLASSVHRLLTSHNSGEETNSGDECRNRLTFSSNCPSTCSTSSSLLCKPIASSSTTVTIPSIRQRRRPSSQDEEFLSDDTVMHDSDTGSGSGSEDKISHNVKRKSECYLTSSPCPPGKKLCGRGPELEQWLSQFSSWSHSERLNALDCLISQCDATQVRHVMSVIEPQFQRDFISLLPKELALYVLSFLEPKDLLKAAQTCHDWRILAEDNLLWREKCREQGIDTPPGITSSSSKSWKRAFMRQHLIETNWRSRPLRPFKVLKGHDDHVITCLQFCGNRIVSGSDDNTLKVWSATTGKCLRVLVGHTGGVWSSQMSGSVVISGSTDRTLKVWNAESGECIHTLYGHTSTVRCMHLHGNKVVSGSRDATLRLWDITSGECLGVLVGHVAAVRCVQYNGKLIVSGAYDYMVKVWHPQRQECLHTLHGHTNRVYSLQFDGVHVVSGSLDTSIRVWDVETGQCKHQLMGHQSLTSGMELKDNILVSGNADSTVKVWDIISGQCLQTLAGANKHQSAVTCLQFNSKFVITSSDDGTVKLWDLKTGEFLRDLVWLKSGGSGGVVWRIRASQTKLVCAVGSRNGTEETQLLVLDFDEECADASPESPDCSERNSLLSTDVHLHGNPLPFISGPSGSSRC